MEAGRAAGRVAGGREHERLAELVVPEQLLGELLPRRVEVRVRVPQPVGVEGRRRADEVRAASWPTSSRSGRGTSRPCRSARRRAGAPARVYHSAGQPDQGIGPAIARRRRHRRRRCARARRRAGRRARRGRADGRGRDGRGVVRVRVSVTRPNRAGEPRRPTRSSVRHPSEGYSPPPRVTFDPAHEGATGAAHPVAPLEQRPPLLGRACAGSQWIAGAGAGWGGADRPHRRPDQVGPPCATRKSPAAPPAPAPRQAASSSSVAVSCTSLPPAARSRSSASPVRVSFPPAALAVAPSPAGTRSSSDGADEQLPDLARGGEDLHVGDRRVPVRAQPAVDLEPPVVEPRRPRRPRRRARSRPRPPPRRAAWTRGPARRVEPTTPSAAAAAPSPPAAPPTCAATGSATGP